mmetsp:Transcript_3654/g.12019  ORF Transcript_3654/g.12019 Transcript_3654/m.12019 type:complete len:335 (+) Transcript_3654:9-1013(+)
MSSGFFLLLVLLAKFSCRSGALTVGAPDGLAEVGRSRLAARGLAVVGTAKDADAVVVRSATTVSDEWLARHPRVKVVVRAGVGMDNVDVEACRARGVGVANTPFASTGAVAELAIAMILCALRRLPQGHDAVRAGNFAAFKKAAEGREVSGKTLGLIGYGAIARRVEEMARCLGLEVVHTSSRNINPAAAVKKKEKSLTPEEVFAVSDVVSIHVPLTSETANLVDAELLSRGENVHLVNCARGGVVVEGDVLRALDEGHLATYSTDVFETEPPDPATDLLNHPLVFLSPHVGAATPETQDRIALAVADAVIALLLDDDDDFDEEEDPPTFRRLA